MRARIRLRLLALAMLALTTLVASEAPAPADERPDVTPPQIVLFQASTTTPTYAVGEIATTYFTIYNPGSDNVMVSIGSGTGPCIMFFSFAAIDVPQGRPTAFPLVLAPSEEQQIRVTATGLTSTTTCTNDVTETNLTTLAVAASPVTITFPIAAMASTTLDVEPNAGLNYVTRFAADPVTQSVRVANLGAAPASETITLPPAAGLSFTGDDGHCSPAAGTCIISLGSGGQAAELDVACAPSAGNSGGGAISVNSGTASLSIMASCMAETPAMSGLSATDLGITGPSSTPATGVVTLTGGGGQIITDAYLDAGPDSTIHMDGTFCSSSYCSFGAGRAVADVPMDCSPTGMMQSATLIVHGLNTLDTAVSNITCTSTGSVTTTPVLDVSPSSLAFGLQPVGMSSAKQVVTISNDPTAGGPLQDVQVTLGDTTNYTLDCGPSPCSLGTLAVGQMASVGVTFDPTAGASEPTTLAVTADLVLEQDVSVSGTGQGAQIVLLQPDPGTVPFGIAFGSIGRGKAQAATIEIQSVGDLDTDTTVALMQTGASVFAVSSGDIPVPQGSTGTVTLTCGSATSGTATGSVTLTTPSVFAGSPIAIPVSCTVADTDVTASPNMVRFGDAQFGELRRDANVGPQTQTITLINNGGSASTLGTVTMAPVSGHVTVAQPSSTTLAANGGSATFTITADPNVLQGSATFDEDFTATPLTLTVPVDGAALTVTATGKVVKAQTALAPAPPTPLDLGTVCLGSTASGTITLTNTGTAHVGTPSAPTMDKTFAITGYAGGVELAPGSPGSASVQTATVAPIRSDQAGELDGTLAWTTDVPDMYQLPVKLVYVAEGGAVSPATLAFATQMAGTESQPQTIDVQNCDTTPLDVTIGDLVQHVGPTSAWNVTPPAAMTLQPSATTPVTVAFRPHRDGHFYAELPITAGSNTTTVQLTGDATGFPPASPTDFYACGCHGSGAPTQGWPVAAVIVVVARRRRRSRQIER
jgi:MYXO-CTERM domain-containing protein|nr:choice-of-anchor D domain-containing protein [Kofleriaceae bacterium]